MNKKVDVIVKYFYPVAAGIEMNVMETYTILAKNGWDVNIHTSKDVYLKKNALQDSEQIRGLNVFRYPFTSFGYFPKINWQNTDVVALHNFDIFPHLRVLLFVLWLKITGKKKFALVITPHGGYNPEWAIYSKIQATIKYIYHYTIGALLINLVSDGVRAVSEWEKDEMIKKFLSPSKVRVIANGLEAEAYEDIDGKASDEIKSKVALFGKYILQVGRIYGIKNYETTIKALAHIPKDINYVIAGPVASLEYENKLIKLISDLGLNDRVIFAGVIRGIDKYYLMKHAQLMVHMAIWESFCNVVHEGLSQGLVCIVANNTALPYLVKNGINGFCVPTFDSKELASKIQYVVDNRATKEISDMSERNKIYALQNSWANVAHKMDLFYRDLI